jgi:hypothetical protein
MTAVLFDLNRQDGKPVHLAVAAQILGVSFQRVQQLVGKASSTQAKSQRGAPRRKAGITRQGSVPPERRVQER